MLHAIIYVCTMYMMWWNEVTVTVFIVDNSWHCHWQGKFGGSKLYCPVSHDSEVVGAKLSCHADMMSCEEIMMNDNPDPDPDPDPDRELSEYANDSHEEVGSKQCWSNILNIFKGKYQ